jgi:ATP-binding cassette subfamily F protein uup
VIVVSHDRWFLDRIATRVVHLDGNGNARMHEGDLSLLLERLAAEAELAARAEAAAKPRAQPKDSAPQPKPRKLSTREQQELAELPGRIESSERELAAVDEGLLDPSVYTAAGRERFEQLTKKRQQLAPQIASLYERWQELEAIAERVQRG